MRIKMAFPKYKRNWYGKKVEDGWEDLCPIGSTEGVKMITICINCEYCRLSDENKSLKKRFRYVCKAPQNTAKHMDLVTGEETHSYEYCYRANNGKCPYYKPIKPMEIRA